MPQFVPSASFPVYYSLLIVQLLVITSELMIVSLNEQMNSRRYADLKGNWFVLCTDPYPVVARPSRRQPPASVVRTGASSTQSCCCLLWLQRGTCSHEVRECHLAAHFADQFCTLSREFATASESRHHQNSTTSAHMAVMRLHFEILKRETVTSYNSTLFIMIIILIIIDGVRLSPLGTSATNWPIVPAPDDRWVLEHFVGMRIGKRNRNSRRKPFPSAICPPQIPHDLTFDRTQEAGD
jgi:hypothetical protein